MSGFSLIELIIVVVIIGIIAVVAIPNMLAARRAGNEASAISSLRTLHGAQCSYYSSTGGGRFAGTNSTTGDAIGLDQLATVKLIEPQLGSGYKSGYAFVGATSLPTTTTAATFFFSANPISTSGVTQSGTRRYNIDTDGVVRFDATNLGTVYDATTTSSGNGL